MTEIFNSCKYFSFFSVQPLPNNKPSAIIIFAAQVKGSVNLGA